MKKNKYKIFDNFDTKGLNIFDNEKILTIEQTKELLIKAKNNDSIATWKIIKHNIGLVKKIVKRFTGYGVEEDDLIQEGCIGIIKAIERFDLNKNIKFSTYVYFYIKKYVYEAIAHTSKSFHITAHIYDILIKYRQFITYYYKKHGLYPNDLQIALFLNLKKEDVINLKRINNSILSIEEKINNDATEIIQNRIHDDTNVEQEVISILLKDEIEKMLNECRLTNREKEIIKYRNGFYNNIEYNLKEIASIFNVTHQRISMIEKEAMKKLEKIKRNNKISDYI